MGGNHRRTSAPEDWDLDTPFTARVTVNDCGELAPVMFVTVIRSPAMPTSNGKSAAAVVQRMPDAPVVATDSVGAVALTPDASCDPSVSARAYTGSSKIPVSNGLSGTALNAMA